MPFVTVQPSGNRIEAASGVSLLSVLLGAAFNKLSYLSVTWPFPFK